MKTRNERFLDQKHGYTEGFRCVEVGCDYGHLYDSERGYGFSLEEVLWDCKETIDQLIDKGVVSPQVPNGSDEGEASRVFTKEESE